MPMEYPKARLSPAKRQLLAIEFRRDEVERGDVRRVYGILSGLIESREAAEDGEGALTFFFSGWDADPREISDIPEIRRWFVRLTEVFPYWLHFAEKAGETLSNALMLLCQGQTERSTETGLVGWRFADLNEVEGRLAQLFSAQSRLYQRLELPQAMYDRVADEVRQLLRCSLE
jgi:hypothetical protein